VFADIAEKVNVRKLREPVGIVDKNGTGRTVIKPQDFSDLFFDAFDIVFDLFFGEEFPFFTFPAGIADGTGGSAGKGDGTVSELLKAAQIHQWNEMSDVQTIGSGIAAGIDGTRFFHKPSGDGVRIGRLVNEFPPRKFLYDVLHAKWLMIIADTKLPILMRKYRLSSCDPRRSCFFGFGVFCLKIPTVCVFYKQNNPIRGSKAGFRRQKRLLQTAVFIYSVRLAEPVETAVSCLISV
jgi:hypothetical protein